MNEIGSMIKYLRSRDRLSQKELADKLHVSASAIGNWEQGTRRPDYETMVKISEVFGITVDELVGNKKTATTSRMEWDKVVNPEKYEDGEINQVALRLAVSNREEFIIGIIEKTRGLTNDQLQRLLEYADLFQTANLSKKDGD